LPVLKLLLLLLVILYHLLLLLILLIVKLHAWIEELVEIVSYALFGGSIALFLMLVFIEVFAVGTYIIAILV